MRKDHSEKIEQMSDQLKAKNRLIRDLRETIKDPEYPKKQEQFKAESERIRNLYKKNNEAAVVKKRKEKLQNFIRSIQK